jgi:hypothetical protein
MIPRGIESPFQNALRKTALDVSGELWRAGRTGRNKYYQEGFRTKTPVREYLHLLLRNEMTLTTSNVREFSTVQGLIWEDWAKAQKGRQAAHLSNTHSNRHAKG